MRIRRIFIWGIAFTPVGGLRRWLYNTLPHYSVDRSARVGWLTTIDVDSLSLGPRSQIRRQTHVRGPIKVALEPEATLGSNNRVHAIDLPAGHDPRMLTFVLGRRVQTATDHEFDATAGIYIGEGTWIGGSGSQFWTHGPGVAERPTIIGSGCYVGSAVRFCPGACVGDDVVVAVGSVVVGDMSAHHKVLLAGMPASVAREDYTLSGWPVDV